MELKLLVTITLLVRLLSHNVNEGIQYTWNFLSYHSSGDYFVGEDTGGPASVLVQPVWPK